MATTIYTPLMLRGAGTRGVPEIPVGSSFTNTYSLAFDGSDTYLDCGVPAYLESSTTVSVSVWLKFDNVGDNDYTGILTLGDASPRDMFLRIAPAGTGRRIEWGLNNSFARATSAHFSDLVSDTWYHIMCFWNTNLNDGTDAQIYLDGNLLFETDTNTSLPASISNSILLADGALWGAFAGNLDELAIWSTDQRANKDEIWDGTGKPTNLADITAPPNAWYRMGDGATYPTIPDEIGSLNGTMTNMVSGDIVADVPS